MEWKGREGKGVCKSTMLFAWKKGSLAYQSAVGKEGEIANRDGFLHSK